MDRVAREIRRDQHQDTFADWGRTLITLGGVIFAAHLAMQLLAAVETGDWLRYWGPRSAMLLVIFLVVYRARGGAMFPQSVAERPIWSIWLGYLATLGVMNLLLWQGAIDRWMLFALASALSGFGFLAMAGHVWGGSALIGAGFLAVAFLIAAVPSLAPLLLGLAWLVGLYVLGRHYRGRRLGSSDRPVSPTLVAHPAQPSRRSDSTERTNQNR